MNPVAASNPLDRARVEYPTQRERPFGDRMLGCFSGRARLGFDTASNGSWVAFETNESGRAVVVQSFPVPFGRWTVSTAGGQWPRWSADGKELYFVVDGKMMASTIHGVRFIVRSGNTKRSFSSPIGLGSRTPAVCRVPRRQVPGESVH